MGTRIQDPLIARDDDVPEARAASSFTAEEVREIAFRIAFPGRCNMLHTVLREYGIAARPSQPVPQPPTPAT